MASSVQAQFRKQERQVSRRSHNAVIRVYDESGNVIETHEQPGELK